MNLMIFKFLKTMISVNSTLLFPLPYTLVRGLFTIDEEINSQNSEVRVEIDYLTTTYLDK